MKCNSHCRSWTAVICVCLATVPLSAHAASYYVSSNGSDTNAGTSPAASWHTLAKVSGAALHAGDTVSFQGGQTFSGTLTLARTDTGTAVSPIVVGSYGTGQATLSGGSGDGIDVSGCAYLTLQNLTVTGAGYKTGNTGVGIKISGGKSVTLTNCTVHGFQKAGVEVDGGSGVRVVHVNASGNGGFGIHSQGNAANVYVGYCTADNNPNDPSWPHPTYNYTGSGIYIDATQGATVEYCEASNNGYEGVRQGGGPVGIWTANSSRVTIQYCIAHDNKTSNGAGDGDGFDIDGGVTNSLQQYCLSYHNQGSGFVFAQYGGAAAWKNNVIRYSLSINDGTNGTGAWSQNGDAAKDGMSSGYQYNNLVYNDHAPAVQMRTSSPSLYFLNNLFVTLSGTAQIQNAAGAVFQSNDYWTLGGGFSVDGYTGFSAWATATGQETIGGKIIGLNADPQLRNLLALQTLTDPTKLKTLRGYQPTAASPLIGQGQPFPAASGISAPAQDFFGTALPVSGSVDIGIAQYVPVVSTPSALNAGGAAASSYAADAAFSGGRTYTAGDVIDTSGVPSPAPQAVYQSERCGTFHYMLTGLTPSAAYRLRLHFAELWWGVHGHGGNGLGQRIFNVTANGNPFLTGFDIVKAAGSPDKAVVETGIVNSDSAGSLLLAFNPASGSPDQNAKLSGLEAAPQVNLLSNGGFETGSAAPFSASGASVIPGHTHSGQYALDLSGTGVGCWQTITGLAPNTTYTLTGFLQSSGDGNGGYLYVQNYGGSEVDSSLFKSTSYSPASVTFMTGSSSTSALLGVWKGDGLGGDLYADDLVLAPQ